MKKYALMGLMLCSFAAHAKEKMCSIKTPVNKIALIEMYTSEACSSCPPGDRAISVLPNANFPSDKVTVLAFHVDYWDHLDWIDPFSRKDFVERHRVLATKNKAKALFTPHFFVNSKEVFNWRKNLVKETNTVNQEKAPISISADYEIRENKLKVDITKNWIEKPQEVDVFVAVSENKILRKITDGENSGETINYHHVVRDLRKMRNSEESVEMSIGVDWKKENLSLIIFVQDKNATVLQSTYDNMLSDCVVKK